MSQKSIFISYVGVTAAVDVEGSDPTPSPPGGGEVETPASDVDPSPGASKPEEQVKERGASVQEGEDFASTDALLEQIAETITSIEKAQNLRASQVTKLALD